jgi:hypothetical protein
MRTIAQVRKHQGSVLTDAHISTPEYFNLSILRFSDFTDLELN